MKKSSTVCYRITKRKLFDSERKVSLFARKMFLQACREASACFKTKRLNIRLCIFIPLTVKQIWRSWEKALTPAWNLVKFAQRLRDALYAKTSSGRRRGECKELSLKYAQKQNQQPSPKYEYIKCRPEKLNNAENIYLIKHENKSWI